MRYRTNNDVETLGAYDPMTQEAFYVTGTSGTGAINVNAIASITGTVNSNITQISGSPITLGQKTMANSLPVTIASDQSPIETLEQTGLIPFEFDYISAAYPDADTEVYSYYVGGSGGTIIATITVNYTDATKEFISNVTRT